MTEGTPVSREHFIRSAYAGRRAGAPESSSLLRVTFLQCAVLARQTLHHKSATHQQQHPDVFQLSAPQHGTRSLRPAPAGGRRSRGLPAGSAPRSRPRRLRTTGRDRPGGDERHAGRRRGERNHAGSAAPPGPVAVMAARLPWARRTGRAPGPVRRDSRLAVLDGPTGTTSPSTTAPPEAGGAARAPVGRR